MLFAFTDEEVMIRATAERIATERLAPLADRLDRGEGRADLLGNLKLLAENGFMALNVRPEFGGTGAGTVAFALSVEALAHGCASTAVTVSVTNMVGEVIQAVGTHEQRSAICPALRMEASPPAHSASPRRMPAPTPPA